MGKSILRGQNIKLVSAKAVVKNKAILNNTINNLCMSARSTGGCLGTQGGGCALVILSISSAKIFKELIEYSKNDYLQSRCGKGRTSEKWTKSVDVRVSSVRPSEHGALLSR